MHNHPTERLSRLDLERAASILQHGGTVAFPTETVYGLGANALQAESVEKIFAAKQRPSWDPLIVHLSDPFMLDRVAQNLPQTALDLMEQFWPGPLTLLLEKSASVPEIVTAGRPLVGVRIPALSLARDLIRLADVPVAAPSANLFGHVSPTTAQHVLDDLDGRIDAVIDGGACDVGVESTVFDPISRILYRPGAVTQAQIERVVGTITVYQPPKQVQRPESLPSPGVGIRHYAPRAHVVLVQDEREALEQIERYAGERVGILLPEGWSVPAGVEVLAWSALSNTTAMAQSLFAHLRAMDERKVARILVPLPKEEQGGALAAALYDRLRKAAMEK